MPVPIKPTITIDDFAKIDIRVGLIEKVSDVEESDKLIELTVDFGDFKKIILSGIKRELENPKSLEGKQTLFIVNLEPRKMAGKASEGMLFALGDDVLPFAIVVPEKPVPNGACAR